MFSHFDEKLRGSMPRCCGGGGRAHKRANGLLDASDNSAIGGLHWGQEAEARMLAVPRPNRHSKLGKY